MKAITISNPGRPEVLTIKEFSIPSPAAHEVLIKVAAAGVNAADAMQRKGTYAAPEGVTSNIPGLEVAGIIENIGSSVSKWKPGDKVCALLAGGGYAEYAIVDEGSCLPVPKGIDIVDAAALPETIFTVWSNVFKRCSLQEGETLLVHGGSSGIGTTAIQMAKALGATVYATAGTEEKCDFCKALGADDCINYKEADFEEVLADKGIDVILDMIGGDYTSKNINLLKPEGRLVFINAMKGNRLEGKISEIMRKRLCITGSTLRSRELTYKAELGEEIQKKVWPLIDCGKFRPVIDSKYPLAEAAKAHERLDSGKHIGKILLVNA